MAANKVQTMVQFMIAKGCVTNEELRELLIQIFGQDSTQIDDTKVYGVVQQANGKLRPYNMMIRQSMDEVTCIKYYALISTVDDEITRAATHHTPKQFEFFKSILQEAVQQRNGIIDKARLGRLAEEAGVAKPVSEFKSLVDGWVRDHWLTQVLENDTPYITLGVRSLAELDVFIKQVLLENTTDLNCKGCDNLAIYAATCSLCLARYHKRCSKMYFHEDSDVCRTCEASSSGNQSRRRS